ncbi:hypothetical protein [Wenzhouxiangella sediminis]|nr:hypothetical protein [Wenzhouxiangella sediminis]
MKRLTAFSLLMFLTAAGTVSAGTVTQTIELRPGWNAIHVEVEPEVNAIEQVFAGLPVASVWRWIPDDRPVSFIQDPDEELMTIDGWYGYFPPERPESILTNLYTIDANQPYLVRLQGSSPRTLEITGRPALRPMRWRSDGFQLTGFPVEPGNEPTFGSWFAGSDAHEGQVIFRLDDNGQWVAVTRPQVERIRSGEAYWVYTKGRSEFQGPLSVELDFGERLDFGASVARDSLVVRNRSGVSNEIRIRRLDADVPVPLALGTRDEETGETEWPVIPDETSFSLPVDESRTLRFGVRRSELFANNASQIIEISNGFGSRKLIEVSAAVFQPPSAATQSRKGASGMMAAGRATDPRFAGLWLGVATIEEVSMAQTGGVVPVPTGSEFPLRMIVHVDAGGNVVLLKEVIQMWQEGTYKPDPDNPEFNVVDEPGRYVLITDESLLPQYEGAILRDGEPVGIRMSTAAYDYEGDELELEGVFGPGGLLTGSIVLDPEHSTNPFLHRFHPDHDNLDAQFINYRQEAFEVTREMEFVFASSDPEGNESPEWGNGEVAGTFNEAISGLHRSTIFVSGSFRFRRVLNIDQLNQ